MTELQTTTLDIIKSAANNKWKTTEEVAAEYRRNNPESEDNPFIHRRIGDLLRRIAIGEIESDLIVEKRGVSHNFKKAAAPRTGNLEKIEDVLKESIGANEAVTRKDLVELATIKVMPSHAESTVDGYIGLILKTDLFEKHGNMYKITTSSKPPLEIAEDFIFEPKSEPDITMPKLEEEEKVLDNDLLKSLINLQTANMEMINKLISKIK